MRKSLIKVVAILACLIFTISLVPAMYAAEKRISKDDRLILQKPLTLLVSIFPFLGSVIDSGSKSSTSTTVKKSLKPTAEIQVGTKPGNDRD
ncbi:MAG: hypothetical protein QHH43_06790 [Candidatus Saccharicenans sp.]|jgi:hypothetical protein|uniref:Uncharacterized protein n=1 Tax=Candidatus Saccharicenans subterraneus TaxID=2508984 RepID=A0A3E2BN27_9BACT|nr:hypothetical protein [Candidatus Saccharicenans sp.]MDH7575448.1 hypothetical protein [Candidatus Saccharicenans sp.]RFT16160.1 MAG: hypothetical protein OP8BY_1764 [Candidatus Saccharicenans subterraneum]